MVDLQQRLSQAKQSEEMAEKEAKKCREEVDAALASYDKVEMVCKLNLSA